MIIIITKQNKVLKKKIQNLDTPLNIYQKYNQTILFSFSGHKNKESTKVYPNFQCY